MGNKKILNIARTILIIIFMCLPWSMISQTRNSESWEILEDDHVEYYEDSTNSLSFEEVLNKDFIPGQTKSFNYQSTYWYRFHLPDGQRSKFLFLHLRMTDLSDVYVPIMGAKSYEHHTVGHFAKKEKKLLESDELHILELGTQNIDFSRPFYINKRIMTQWSKLNWKYLPGYLFASNTRPLESYLLEMRNEQNSIYFYIGIVFISFFLFVVNFFISKDKSYLIYGLYLLGVTIYYANRLPLFLNVYQKGIPELGFYVNQLAHIANIGLYTWFVFYFLDFKKNFPKAYPFTRALLIGILAFGILYGFQIIFFPYFPYRFLVMDVFRIVVMVTSVILFLFLMFQKPDFIAKIVLVGSLVLIAGNVFSLVLGDYTIFLKLMVLEIILFSIVVALRNKQINRTRIMDRYKLEAQKMKNQTLEELNATKSRFYENITHEFRTPLTLILSPIEKKLSQSKIPEKEKEEFGLIQRHARQLLSLVNQMLDLAKLEENNVKLSVGPGNLLVFLEPLINVYQQEAKNKNIVFTTDLKNTGTTWFDPQVVEKVTANLLSNAVKHTPENGNINVSSHIKNGYWIFNVTNSTDPNIHINVSKLFNRYYRAGEHSQGAGVGLNIAKELVELSHGNITANTLENEEIQFMVSLPIEETFFKHEVESEQQGIENKSLSNDDIIEPTTITTQVKIPVPLNIPISHGHPTLLIVEDNADMRAFIKSNFIEDYQILEAENGSLGMEQAIKHLPDLIISDVMMPVKNGFELCDAIKQNTFTSHIPVILLTAKVGEENEIQGFKTGADAYITKPFSVEKLKVRTRQLIKAQKRLAEHYRNTFSINPELAITNTEADFLKLLKTVLDEHITDPDFNTETFGKLMGMSRRQLHRKLKAIIGMTPNEFVRNERLKLAADLLKKSDATVAEIAYQVGFNTPSYFIKSFKEVYQCTPNEFSGNK